MTRYDWGDMANYWNRNWDLMEVEPTPAGVGRKRGRSRSRTPATRKRADRAPSRARAMQPRRLTFSSVRTRSRSRSASLPPKKLTGKAAFFAARKNLPFVVKEAMWRQTAQGKRNQATLDKLKTRKVRHNLTRKMARYSKRRTTARRKPYKKRGYRGALMPRWAKGETKHILAHDNCTTLAGTAGGTINAGFSGIDGVNSTHSSIALGDIAVWTLNPVTQGNSKTQRNGASVDGTYLRIQGHIHNTLTRDNVDTSVAANTHQSATASGGRAYVRMLVLAVKGQSAVSSTGAVITDQPRASFVKENMFKKINGDIVGFDTGTSSGAGSKRVRSLQLPINRSAYTVLADMKHELSAIDEGFGASDRLFDKKIKLKQRTTWSDSACNTFEKNQLVLVMYAVDPQMRDSHVATYELTSGGDALTSTVERGVGIEFESKYSYKDF